MSSGTRIGSPPSPATAPAAAAGIADLSAPADAPSVPCRPWGPNERTAWLWHDVAAIQHDANALLALMLLRWRVDPVVFAFEALHTALMPYQAQALLDVGDAPAEVYAFYGLDPSFPKRRVLLPSGHGLGKTRLMAVAIWWHTLTVRASKRLCTAPTSDQLTGNLWGECRKLFRRLEQRWPRLAANWEIQTQAIVHKDPKWADWVTLARTARAEKPEGLQGAHALDEDDVFGDLAHAHGQRDDAAKGGGILVLVDEASGVDDAIREVLTGALSEDDSRFLAAGNPTRNDGWFARDVVNGKTRYAVHHLDCRLSNREQVYALPYRAPSGQVSQIRVRGFVRPSYWEDLLKECEGDEDHDRFRVRVRGQIPRANEEQINRPEWIERAQDRAPDAESTHEPVVISVDFGQTSDKHALAVRQGFNCLELIEWLPKTDPDDVLNEAFRRACDAVATWRNSAPRHARIKVTLIGDSNGVGAGVVGRLVDEYRNDPEVRVMHFNSGLRAHDAARYSRRRDEMWLKRGRPWLASPRCSLPRVPGIRLKAQLCAPSFTEGPDRRMKVETKEAVTKRTGERSGNAADALLQSLMILTEPEPAPKAPERPVLPPMFAEHERRLQRLRDAGNYIR